MKIGKCYLLNVYHRNFMEHYNARLLRYVIIVINVNEREHEHEYKYLDGLLEESFFISDSHFNDMFQEIDKNLIDITRIMSE